MTVAITTYQLRNLLRRVDPHIGRRSGYGPIQGVRLDYDGRHLHAVGTDRYTLAAARLEAKGNLIPWAATVYASDLGNHLAAVTGWLDAQDAQATITLTANIGQPGASLTLANGSERHLTVPVYDGDFPNWRGLIRTAINREGTESPWTGYTSDLLARWQSAGRDICVWQSAFDKPLVVTANDFIGVQMPRPISDEESPAGRNDDWASTLGTGEPVEMDDTLSTWEPQELEERDNVIGSHAEELLKMTLRYTGGSPGAEEPVARTAHYLAAIHGWTAYRLLKALQKADPDLLRTVLADTGEELESGEIGEWAWDEATQAGHDPEVWDDDYKAHLKKLAAEKAEAAA